MPDIRNVSEADAADAVRAALITAGLTPSAITVRLFPSATTTGSGDYNDVDYLGDPGYATSVGADGTISWQDPAPAAGIPYDEVDVDVWGVTQSVWDPLFTTADLWGTAPEYRLFVDPPPDPGPSAAVSSFVIELMSRHRPTAGPGEVLTTTLPDESTIPAVPDQYSDVSVKETLNDTTECSFVLSMFDPHVVHVDDAYTTIARIWYRGQPKPIYYGPVTFSEDYGEAKVTITGVNVIHLQHHFLRRGDDALNEPGDRGDHGHITLDGDGLATLLQAAQNTATQDARDVPALGIAVDDHSTAHPKPLVGVNRGENVWDRMRELVDSIVGPDMEFDPQIDLPGVYMAMRVWDRRGSDRTATVRWYFNIEDQADNVADIQAAPLLPITHAHVIDTSTEARYRVTAASLSSSYDRGVFVDWTEYQGSIRKDPDTHLPDLDPLRNLAKAQIDSYSRAPRAIEITLRPDAGQTTFYREHFWPGDVVYVHAKKGYREFDGEYRITAVTVGAAGPRGLATTSVTVVPSVAADSDDEDS